MLCLIFAHSFSIKQNDPLFSGRRMIKRFRMACGSFLPLNKKSFREYLILVILLYHPLRCIVVASHTLIYIHYTIVEYQKSSASFVILMPMYPLPLALIRQLAWCTGAAFTRELVCGGAAYFADALGLLQLAAGGQLCAGNGDHAVPFKLRPACFLIRSRRGKGRRHRAHE